LTEYVKVGRGLEFDTDAVTISTSLAP
jgi:hypothetical protein